MHPDVMEELARQRERELRKAAERYLMGRSRRWRRGSVRYRASRALTVLGPCQPADQAMPDTREGGHRDPPEMA